MANDQFVKFQNSFVNIKYKKTVRIELFIIKFSFNFFLESQFSVLRFQSVFVQ